MREKYARPVAAAEKKIVDQLPAIVDAQIGLALGVYVERTNEKTGAREIYLTPPDVKAGQYLINRILGLPTAKVNVAGADGGDIIVRWVDPDGTV